MRRWIGIAAVFIGLAVVRGAWAESGPRVNVAGGELEGAEEVGVWSFKGVRFAEAPIGDLRWKAPVPAKGWSGVREAKAFGARPMQLDVFGDMRFRSAEMSEDCLFLNVWGPAGGAGEEKGLPVLVYFYGGGFVAGAADESRYDGAAMARRGMVVVTVNHRLGVFGFLTHPELTAEKAGTGNWGLRDQQLALKWVKENIGAFGGDAARVTIGGESAGSISVSAQMASPGSKGLFAGAIGQSGSVMGALSAVPLAKGEAAGVKLMTELGKSLLAELRAMGAEELLKAKPASGIGKFGIVVDGEFLTAEPGEVFARGEQARVPLLVGWNSMEGSASGVLGRNAATRENFAAGAERMFPGRGAEVANAYLPAAAGEGRDVVEAASVELASDRFISLSTWRWATAQARAGVPVYRYYYVHPRPGMRPEFAGATAGLAGGVVRGATSSPATRPATQIATATRDNGAVHSAEIEYALGNLSGNPVFAWTAEDEAVSTRMQTYFANFVKRGDPNGAGLEAWPAMGTGKPGEPAQVMRLGVTAEASVSRTEGRYELLERVVGK